MVAFSSPLRSAWPERDDGAPTLGIAGSGKDSLLAVHSALDIDRPFLSAVPSEEGLVDMLPLRRTCARHELDFYLLKVATACARRVH